MSGYMNWRNFWVFWLGGLVVFFSLAIPGQYMITDVAPGGLMDHQSAGTAARVNEIQQSWVDAGALNIAKWGMLADLLFINLYMIGGVIGGRLLWHDAHSPSLKKLGLFCILLYLLFGLSDNIETICQIIQVIQNNGSDLLAGTAAIARPVKMVAFILGTIAMIAALIWRRRERRA